MDQRKRLGDYEIDLIIDSKHKSALLIINRRENQRVSNENLNGLIRQLFPVKSNYESLTQKEIKNVENNLYN